MKKSKEEREESLKWEPYYWPVLGLRFIIGHHPRIEKILIAAIVLASLYFTYQNFKSGELDWPIKLGPQ